jgi:hypothetical protein
MTAVIDPPGSLPVHEPLQPVNLGELNVDRKPVVQRRYQCRCGRPVFFRNSVCLACRTPLGYEPSLSRVCALDPLDGDTWGLSGWLPLKTYRRCANLESPAACNWLLEAGEPQELCQCCRLNRTIPDLTIQQNADDWNKIEIAKRRLVSSLIALGLPVRSRVTEDPEQGIAFDFLRSLPGGPRVITGHENGIITLNIEEADDATREWNRKNLNEPYRTLLGHLRHEVGHYYWDRLIAGTSRYRAFQEIFGDETQDYASALQRHYSEGPPLDWRDRYVSAYASAHPWEDWAETWAHYLHIGDTWDTALSFGMDVNAGMEFDGFTAASLAAPDQAGAGSFLQFLNSWTQLTAVLNELSRAMGLADFYPFVLSQRAVAKLHFVHMAVVNPGTHIMHI